MKIFIFLFLTSLTILLFIYKDGEKVISPNLKNLSNKVTTSPSFATEGKKLEKSIFVPYWSIQGEIDKEFDPVIYFGITPDTKGINREDQGYLKIEKFIKKIGNQRRFLTVRMTDQKINFKVLDDKSLQKKIIKESVQIAKKYSFNGIVLDIEISSLYFESVVKDINDFSIDFYSSSRENNLNYSVALYGDTFYRLRPYNVSTLSKNSDKIMIMAYDFHKSRGNPGPNFPLFGREKYGYDLAKMIHDFKSKVPPEKITVILGMFGYDWMVDDKGQPLDTAKPLSTNEIKNTFISKCSFKSCSSVRDKESFETKINYIDFNNNKHIIWFEDEDSAEQKADYIRQNGIDSIGFWAYSYF